MKVQNGQVPASYNAFLEALRRGFIPYDIFGRSKDKLRNIMGRTLVSFYISELGNLTLSNPGIK